MLIPLAKVNADWLILVYASKLQLHTATLSSDGALAPYATFATYLLHVNHAHFDVYVLCYL